MGPLLQVIMVSDRGSEAVIVCIDTLNFKSFCRLLSIFALTPPHLHVVRFLTHSHRCSHVFPLGAFRVWGFDSSLSSFRLGGCHTLKIYTIVALAPANGLVVGFAPPLSLLAALAPLFPPVLCMIHPIQFPLTSSLQRYPHS